MFQAITHYLETCSCLELIGCDLLAVAGIGTAIFLPAWVCDHVSVARRVSQGIR